jgi:Na+/glutamate symporter
VLAAAAHQKQQRSTSTSPRQYYLVLASTLLAGRKLVALALATMPVLVLLEVQVVLFVLPSILVLLVVSLLK